MPGESFKCSGCNRNRSFLSPDHSFLMNCDCAISPHFCLNCHSRSIQIPYGPIPEGYPPRITCKWCSKSGPIRMTKTTHIETLRFWESLQQIPHWYMHSKTLLVRISSNWRVFSKYYLADFLSLTSHRLETIQMMYSLHQLFFVSQMFSADGPPTRIQLICNPKFQKSMSRILLINWARKLVCKLFSSETRPSETLSFNLSTRKIKYFPSQEIKMTQSFNLFKQSYLQKMNNRFLSQKMMHRLLMYLMAHL